MVVSVKADEIQEAINRTEKSMVSVEVKVPYALEAWRLFALTESDSGDRCFFKNETMSFFGYKPLRKYKNDSESKQTIFKEWETLKHDIALIHPESEKHHLKLCGGFQFSNHKSEEWQQYGFNHFLLPGVLVTIENDVSYITVTESRDDFSIEKMNTLVAWLTEADVVLPEHIAQPISMEDIHKSSWRALVKEAIDTIDETKKVVLARRRLIKFDRPIHLAQVVRTALQNEKSSYLFVLESEDATFLSQTPEQLMRVDDDHLSTKAVAGTIKRTHDETLNQHHLDAFLNDDKNLREHHFVVRSILDDIQNYAVDIDYSEQPKIMTNDHLYHLFTKIQGTLKENRYIGLLDTLHPTPALGGFPKREAMDFIETKEFGTRGLYGAPVGYVDIYDDCEFIVAIRSMLMHGSEATLFAGCGIVKSSDPDMEIEETAVKFKPMMSALGVEENDKS